jgi:hypothetical protein
MNLPTLSHPQIRLPFHYKGFSFDGLLENYWSLSATAGTIVRNLKKTQNADIRRKLVQELQSLDKKRAELLDQMDNLAKSA